MVVLGVGVVSYERGTPVTPEYVSVPFLFTGSLRFDTKSTLQAQLLHRNVQRFRGGLVVKAHRLCVSLNSRLESNKEGEESDRYRRVRLLTP